MYRADPIFREVKYKRDGVKEEELCDRYLLWRGRQEIYQYGNEELIPADFENVEVTIYTILYIDLCYYTTDFNKLLVETNQL